MIWISSDLHFNHDREFIWGARGFTSVEQMNENIIFKHNLCVQPDDDVYILGDLCLGDLEKGRECLSRLNGRLHVIYGNHDTPRRKQMYSELPNFVEAADALTLTYKKYHFYLSHYPTLTSNLEKESLHQMTLCLYGHTHQKTNFFEDRPYMYHVGVDSHNCFPSSFDEIIVEIKEKVNECKFYLD